MMLTPVASNHCCVSPVKLTNKFALLDNEEELPDLCPDGRGHQCGCSGQVGISVASGGEYVAGRSTEREWKVPADYACRGSGSSGDDELPGTPLMSPRSAPEYFAGLDSWPVDQCTACADYEIGEKGCPGGKLQTEPLKCFNPTYRICHNS